MNISRKLHESCWNFVNVVIETVAGESAWSPARTFHDNFKALGNARREAEKKDSNIIFFV